MTQASRTEILSGASARSAQRQRTEPSEQRQTGSGSGGLREEEGSGRVGAASSTPGRKAGLGEAGLPGTQQTTGLEEECKDFGDKIGQFQKTVGSFMELADQLATAAANARKASG
uniref:Uncharacterized protein n=1 Tax=Prolemur simus TaxID=1328070 RepID=A0A8C8YGX0_PROSS